MNTRKSYWFVLVCALLWAGLCWISRPAPALAGSPGSGCCNTNGRAWYASGTVVGSGSECLGGNTWLHPNGVNTFMGAASCAGSPVEQTYQPATLTYPSQEVLVVEVPVERRVVVENVVVERVVERVVEVTPVAPPQPAPTLQNTAGAGYNYTGVSTLRMRMQEVVGPLAVLGGLVLCAVLGYFAWTRWIPSPRRPSSALLRRQPAYAGVVSEPVGWRRYPTAENSLVRLAMQYGYGKVGIPTLQQLAREGDEYAGAMLVHLRQKDAGTAPVGGREEALRRTAGDISLPEKIRDDALAMLESLQAAEEVPAEPGEEEPPHIPG